MHKKETPQQVVFQEQVVSLYPSFILMCLDFGGGSVYVCIMYMSVCAYPDMFRGQRVTLGIPL